MGTGAAAAVLNLSHKPISLMETQGWGREEKEVFFSLFLLLVALSRGEDERAPCSLLGNHLP